MLMKVVKMIIELMWMNDLILAKLIRLEVKKVEKQVELLKLVTILLMRQVAMLKALR